MNTAWVNDPAWTERYESLRRHVLGEAGRLQSAPLGLLLFIREGLAAWMRRWNQPPPVSASAKSLSPMLPLASGWQRELTFLLAQITTVHLEANRAQ
jgi:hypothetical protein